MSVKTLFGAARRFSPRNGEVILKAHEGPPYTALPLLSFSPRNGEVILKLEESEYRDFEGELFQSPQWGSNSKGVERQPSTIASSFSPRNGEVILKFYIY